MSKIEMRRFDVRLLKNKTTGDSAQVPAAGATFSTYRQGATVKDTVNVLDPDTVQVPVPNTGRIQVGDALQLGLDGSRELQVSAIDPMGNWIEIQYAGMGAFELQAGTRLVPTNARPTLYGDSLGQNALSGSDLTVPTQGWLTFYCPENRFDSIFSGSGVDPRLFQDNPGGLVFDGVSALNAAQFRTVQAAVDALPPTGGTIYFPHGTYVLTSQVSINKRGVILLGDGSSSSVIQDCIQCNISYV